MNSKVAKQFIEIDDKPVLYYSIDQFQKSKVDDIVLVVEEDKKDYVQKEIIDKFSFSKVKVIISGGKERYNSVYNALKCIDNSEYVLIHDGARPLITQEIIKNCINDVIVSKAAVVGMPAKDTIKIVDNDRNVIDTPDRSNVWIVQTPQSFKTSIVREAYEKMIRDESVRPTDDAMVVEKYGNIKIHMIEGSYSNIKITTPDDLVYANEMLKKR